MCQDRALPILERTGRYVYFMVGGEDSSIMTAEKLVNGDTVGECDTPQTAGSGTSHCGVM